MATKIEEIYDEICNLIETTLPDAKRFPNPYRMEVNALGRVDSAYGIEVGTGENTERYVGCLVSWQRNFTLRILRKITTTENNLGKRVILEKGILADHDALQKAFYNTTLGNRVIKTIVTDDGGIQFLDGDTLKFLMMEITILVEYQESSI